MNKTYTLLDEGKNFPFEYIKINTNIKIIDLITYLDRNNCTLFLIIIYTYGIIVGKSVD